MKRLPIAERAQLVKEALHSFEVQRFNCELNLVANPGATDTELADERKQLEKLTKAVATLQREYRAELAYSAPTKKGRG